MLPAQFTRTTRDRPAPDALRERLAAAQETSCRLAAHPRVPGRPGGEERPRPRGGTDPLAATVEVARACERLSSIQIFGAGERLSGRPPLPVLAMADTGPLGGISRITSATPVRALSHRQALGRVVEVPVASRADRAMDAPDRREPAGQRLFIYTCARAHRVVVRFVGELDLVDADRARTALSVDHAATVVLDLTDLRFIDAAGVAAIVDARRALLDAGHRLQLRGAQGVVRRVLEITDLAYLLHD